MKPISLTTFPLYVGLTYCMSKWAPNPLGGPVKPTWLDLFFSDKECNLAAVTLHSKVFFLGKWRGSWGIKEEEWALQTLQNLSSSRLPNWRNTLLLDKNVLNHCPFLNSTFLSLFAIPSMSCGAIWCVPHFLMGRKSVLKAPIKTTQVHGIDDRGPFWAHLKNFSKHPGFYGGLRQILFHVPFRWRIFSMACQQCLTFKVILTNAPHNIRIVNKIKDYHFSAGKK